LAPAGKRAPPSAYILRSTDPDLSLNVPIKERSLEIFRDEKRLDRLRAGSDCLLRRFSLSSSQRIPGIRVHGLVLDDADVH
jgi:hypothetical protein